VDECGAPEFFTGGAKLATLDGDAAKLTPATLEAALPRFRAPPHSPKPSAVSIAQATELCTVYTAQEIAAIAVVARREGMKLHMDGARFANAIVHLGCTPADATWRAGIDVLSFGATKNGALCAEAVVFFNPEDVRDFEYRRKKAGHLLSKMRFVSAQLVSYLEGGRWLAMAGRANALAVRLGEGLSALPEVEIAYRVEANAVFVRLPDGTVAKLRAAGAHFYDWSPPAQGRTLARLVTSFATPEDDIDRFLAVARN
jgi:threonine aldolase